MSKILKSTFDACRTSLGVHVEEGILRAKQPRRNISALKNNRKQRYQWKNIGKLEEAIRVAPPEK